MKLMTSFFALGLMLSPAAYAHGGHIPLAQQAQPTPISTTDLGDGLYMLQGRGGNIGVLAGEDGVFVIDSQYADMAPGILNAIDVIAGETPTYLVNTHWHSDHAGSNAKMAEVGALVVAHENVRRRLSSDQVIEFFGADRPASPPAAWPVLTFTSDLRFHLNGDEVDVMHVANAHTDGDAIVHFRKANVIHTGDVFFNGFYPFIDGGTGGSLRGMIAAVDRILALADDETRIVPGHGPLGDRKALANYRDMLDGVHHAVANLMVSANDVDAVVAARPTAAFDAEWGGGFLSPETFTRLVFDLITRDTLD